MRAMLLAVLLVSCGGAVVAPVRTEDPRVFALQAERDILAARLAAPEFVMWNSPMGLVPKQLLTLGLPDSFTTHVHMTATTPVRARVMTFDDYVRYRNTGLSSVPEYGPATLIDFTFHDAEGCGAYLLVLDAERDSVITPNVTLMHVEAGHPPTGVCVP